MKRGRNVLAEQPGLPGVARTNFWTPDDLYNELNAKYGPFTVDAAADESNAKCAKYFDESQDGRFQEWTGRVWCNPPYKDLITWVRKAYESTVGGGVRNCSNSYTGAHFDRVVSRLRATICRTSLDPRQASFWRVERFRDNAVGRGCIHERRRTSAKKS